MKHLKSVKCDEPANKLNLKLWQEADLIVSVLFRIKVMTIREFRGEQHELAFLQFFYQNARTTGLALFAECRIHSAKALLHSAKSLPSVALGKPHSVKKMTAKAHLPSVFFSGTR